MAHLLHLLLLFLLLLPVISGVSDCYRFSGSCSACIQADPRCAWDVTSDVTALWRCSPQYENNAPPNFFFPHSSVKEKVASRDFELDLRVNDPRSITVKVQLEKKAPVDIYVLSDMSYSMKDYLEEIGSTADILLKNIEKDAGKGRVRLGFGGFVDKPVMPFQPPSGGASCKSASETSHECEDPYSYRHVLNFTNDDGLFKKVMATLKSSVSQDSPDGGLEALLQTAVCPKVLGWNPKALKIVALLTSSGIHIQGDGLLAGIAKLADLRCHMGRTPNGAVEYTRSLEVDYPSIGLVSEALEKAGMTVIFLAKKKVLPLFRQLSKELPSASAAQLPEKNRTNEVAEIAGILSRSYHKITKLVTFDRLPDEFRSEIETLTLVQCHPDATWQKGSECPEVRLGGIVQFRVTVRARKCLPSPAEIRFRVTGLDGSAVQLRVTAECDCKYCETLKAPTECAVDATLVCGECRCPPGRTGLRCECDEKDERKEDCRDPKRPETLCNGRGRCSCGKCFCSDGFAGQLCGCLTTCPTDDLLGRVCGGSARGECRCNGTCGCRKGFAGEACDCVDDNGKINCREKESKKILEGRSICSNDLIRNCVFCHHDKTLPNAINARTACQKECLGQEKMIVALNETVTRGSKCVVEKEDNCRIVFSHELKNERLNLIIGKHCQVGAVHQAALPLFMAVIASIILVGLLLIGVWKLVVHVEDKAEYNRLIEYEKMWAGATNSNPLYQSPETEVKNPLFRASSGNEDSRMVFDD